MSGENVSTDDNRSALDIKDIVCESQFRGWSALLFGGQTGSFGWQQKLDKKKHFFDPNGMPPVLHVFKRWILIAAVVLQ